jgi:putative tryptophan/tyrosine transport system substrate-binding protein
MGLQMKRREFIAGLGGAAGSATIWPLTARAQQRPQIIGYLSGRTGADDRVIPFRQGLKDAGYLEGQNVAIEYRFADEQYDRLAALATDLVRRQVTVIVAAGLPTALAAKAATATIPIVFQIGGDPVELGLVASMNRPGGNITGVSTLNVEVVPKQLELLHEVIPMATVVALLVNPANQLISERTTRDAQVAASTLGLRLHVLHASTERDFDTVFATLGQLRAGALVIGPDTLFSGRVQQLGALTLRHAVPAICPIREFVAAGGLMSYGGPDSPYLLVGAYAGRILKGEKPADLPVQQRAKIELAINLKTAKALGLTIPLPLLALADKLIE